MNTPGRPLRQGIILAMILALLVSTMPVMACEDPTPTPAPTPAPPSSPPGTPAPNPNWYDCNWQYRKAVTIDKAKVAGSQSNFPILVSLASDPELSAHARSDGHDILFTSSDGTTKIPHEIESYTGSSGKLVAWVKVPALSSAEYTTLYMYYGFSASADQQERNNVWNSNYRGVWHLKEDPSASSPQMRDSTSKGNHGSSRGTMTRSDQVAGKAGGSLDFDGTNDYLNAANSGSSLNVGQAFTLEAWVKRDGTGPETLLTKTYGDQYSFKLSFTSADVLRLDVNTGSGYTNVMGNTITDTNWHHVAAYSDGTKLKLITDGVVHANTGSTPSAIPYDSSTLFIGVGRWGGNPVDYWDGSIDEVRISTGARSSGWIRTGYNNQKSPSTFHYLSAEDRAGNSEACYLPEPPQPDPGICTIAVDATSSGGADDTQSISIPHTTTGTDRLMLVGVSINDDELETVSSITYDGAALARVGAIDNSRSGGDDARVEIWQLLAPATGTHSVLISFSAPLEEQAVVGVMTFTGVDQESPLGTFASSENDPSPAKVTVSSGPYDLVFGVLASEYGAITTGWGQTERWNLRPDADDTYGAGSTKPGADSVGLQWTLTGDPHWAAGGVSVRPCVIPPPPPPPPQTFSCPEGTGRLVTDDGETVGCVAITNDATNLNVEVTSSPLTPLVKADWTWGIQKSDIPMENDVPLSDGFPYSHAFGVDEPPFPFPPVDIGFVTSTDIAYLYIAAHGETASGEDAWVLSDTYVDGTGAPAKYFTYIIQAADVE